MLALRKLWTILLGAWVAEFIAVAVLDWMLGLEGTWVLVVILIAAAVGGFAGIREARQVQPMAPDERRDTILGWGTVIVGVGAVACLVLPFPWSAFAAAAVLAVGVVMLRRVVTPSRHQAQ